MAYRRIMNHKSILKLLGRFFYTERKLLIIEAYVEDNEYNLKPEAKEESNSTKQPILKSLKKRYFYLETESRIGNKKMVKAIFENVKKTYQLKVVAYKVISAKSDIEYKNITNIENIILEPIIKNG